MREAPDSLAPAEVRGSTEGTPMTSRLLETQARSRTAHEFARDALRRAILDGRLRAGTKLRQGQLAAELGVSTTPLREALRDLAAEGFIVIEPQRGAVVRGLRVDEVREIYDLRIILEPVALARSLGQLTDDVYVEAEQLMAQMEPERDTSRWAELNRNFHDLFIAPVANTRLGQILSGLRDSAAVYVGISLQADPAQMAQASVEHREFVQACRDGDIDQVLAITRVHLQATVDAIARAHQGVPPDAPA